jgi:hypothetical protein
MPATDDPIERQQIEEVFGLGGGELSDKPWQGFPYWYVGIPDYLGRAEYPDQHSSGIEYRTVVTCLLYGDAPTIIDDGSQRWQRTEHFTSSGETECPWAQADDGPTVTADQAKDGECPLCGESVGSEHRYIYLGDGWSEVIYRNDRTDDLERLATENNMCVWEERITDVFCACGYYELPRASAHAASVLHCPSCDKVIPSVVDGEPTIVDTEKTAWWFWCCSPGCMPESEPSGPYDTREDALEAACEGLEE